MSIKNEQQIEDCGRYRSHLEPMVIVSNKKGHEKIFFEAPPSHHVPKEMQRFIEWLNLSSQKLPILARAAIAHVYFESIHPFEDGNGRIGRLLIEKILSQGIKRPALIAVSQVLEKKRKHYYAELEKCNKSLNIQHWLIFLAQAIIEAHKSSVDQLNFLIEKAKLFSMLAGKINDRQQKVLLRMFAEGAQCFKEGLSTENYIAITKISRATATRDLADLVEKSALRKTGELRHTRYWLNIRV